MATSLSDRSFALEPVFIADADCLGQTVYFPASATTPLFRLMFPRPRVDFSEQQKVEIIRWHVEGIRDAIMGVRTRLLKIRQGNGTVVGLAAWVMERCLDEPGYSSETKTSAERTRVGNENKSKKLSPKALDVPTWLKVSEALKQERQRATGHLDNICRTLQRTPAWVIFAANSCAMRSRDNHYVHLPGAPTSRTRLHANAVYF